MLSALNLPPGLPAGQYSEEILRYPAVTAEGKPCEILERQTWFRTQLKSGVLGKPKLLNQRFDLRTGERVNKLSKGQFEIDVAGTRLKLLKPSTPRARPKAKRPATTRARSTRPKGKVNRRGKKT